MTPELRLIRGLGQRSTSALATARRQLRPLLPDIARLLREEAMLDRELAARAADAGKADQRRLKRLREHCATRCSTLLHMTQHPRRRGGGSDDILTMIPTLDAPEITAQLSISRWLAGLSSAYTRAERRANEVEDTVLALRFCAMQSLVEEDLGETAGSNMKEKRA